MNTNTVTLIQEFNSTYLPLVDLGLKVIGFTSLFFIWYQIRQARLWNKLKSEFNFVNLSKDAEFELAVQNAFKTLGINLVGRQTPLDPAEVTKVFSDENARHATKTFLNYFENTCAAINIGHADEDLAFAVHSAEVLRTYMLFQPFIAEIRSKYNDDELYVELEKTYLRWEAIEGKKRKAQQKAVQRLKKKLEKSRGVQSKT
jgi:hypothetical protein